MVYVSLEDLVVRCQNSISFSEEYICYWKEQISACRFWEISPKRYFQKELTHEERLLRYLQSELQQLQWELDSSRL